jgi:hypothetical protein
MNIEERIFKLQSFIDEISSLIVQHGEYHAIQGNLFLYRGFAIMIKELYELRLPQSTVETQQHIDKEKERDQFIDWMIRDLKDKARDVAKPG